MNDSRKVSETYDIMRLRSERLAVNLLVPSASPIQPRAISCRRFAIIPRYHDSIESGAFFIAIGARRFQILLTRHLVKNNQIKVGIDQPHKRKYA
jgi:hypothetical protein